MNDARQKDEQDRNLESEVKALSSHYPRRQLSPGDYERWLSDYAGDLETLAASDVRLACAIWRQGESKKMPTPGELKAACNRLHSIEQAARVIEPPPRYVPSPEEHRRVSDGFARLAESFTANRMDFRQLARRSARDASRPSRAPMAAQAN